MTIEQKAKAYDEALERARSLQHDNGWVTTIFPELKESEDEKIRGKIVSILEQYALICAKEGDPCLELNDCLAYLEKQKKQEPIEPELKIHDWVHGGWDNEYMINTVIGRYSLHAEVAKKRGDTHDYNLSKSMENWLRNVVKPLILDKPKEQKPAEWSDSVTKEMFIKALERAVEQTKKGYELTDCDKHSWWENFKAYSGINPAEWSEEDEMISEHELKVLKLVAEKDGTCLMGLYHKLKSLRPQHHWKPSEEQMRVFLKATPVNLMPEELGVFHSLYNDLEKLIEL